MTVVQICQRDVDLIDLDEKRLGGCRANAPAGGWLADRAQSPPPAVGDYHRPRSRGAGDGSGEVSSDHPCARHHDDAREDLVGKHQSIEWALAVMHDNEIRRLPVVDGEGKLVGVLALDDILSVLAKEFHEIGRLLNRQTPRAAIVRPGDEG